MQLSKEMGWKHPLPIEHYPSLNPGTYFHCFLPLTLCVLLTPQTQILSLCPQMGFFCRGFKNKHYNFKKSNEFLPKQGLIYLVPLL